MGGHFTCPKVGGRTAVILSESDVVVDQIVSEAGSGHGVVPVDGDDDDVGFGVGLDGGLERLSGVASVHIKRVVAALSALSLLANCVLIDVNQSLVLENGFRGKAHAGHVSSEDKW